MPVALQRFVQKVGTQLSRRVFTDRMLATDAGKRLYLFSYGAFKSLFESSELELMRPWIEPGSTVVDVGANVGFMTTFFSETVGANGSVLAVEPDPIAGDVLRFNLHRRRCRNVQVVCAALGEADGSAVLHQNRANRADSRLAFDSTIETFVKPVPVPVRSFSSLVEEHLAGAHISLVKIDTQGYETHVLKGMRRWLEAQSTRPPLALEYWPYGLRLAGSSGAELEQVLRELGYEVPDTQQSDHSVGECADDYITLLCRSR